MAVPPGRVTRLVRGPVGPTVRCAGGSSTPRTSTRLGCGEPETAPEKPQNSAWDTGRLREPGVIPGVSLEGWHRATIPHTAVAANSFPACALW